MKYLFLVLSLLIVAPDLSAHDGPRRKRCAAYGVRKQKGFTSCRKARRILHRRHR